MKMKPEREDPAPMLEVSRGDRAPVSLPGSRIARSNRRYNATVRSPKSGYLLDRPGPGIHDPGAGTTFDVWGYAGV